MRNGLPYWRMYLGCRTLLPKNSRSYSLFTKITVLYINYTNGTEETIRFVLIVWWTTVPLFTCFGSAQNYKGTGLKWSALLIEYGISHLQLTLGCVCLGGWTRNCTHPHLHGHSQGFVYSQETHCQEMALCITSYTRRMGYSHKWHSSVRSWHTNTGVVNEVWKPLGSLAGYFWFGPLPIGPS